MSADVVTKCNDLIRDGIDLMGRFEDGEDVPAGTVADFLAEARAIVPDSCIAIFAREVEAKGHGQYEGERPSRLAGILDGLARVARQQGELPSFGVAFLKGKGTIKRWWLRKRQPVTWSTITEGDSLRVQIGDVQWSRPNGPLARLADRLLPTDTIACVALEVDGKTAFEWPIERQGEVYALVTQVPPTPSYVP